MTTPNSSLGGYLQPAPPTPLPGGLTFKQFLQTVFVGISGLNPTLVRPRWQKNAPKQPDVDVNWLAFGITHSKADTFAFNGVKADGSNITTRNEWLEIQCAFYGPDAYEIAALVRDGFQITQNLEALNSINTGFLFTSDIMHVPDLVNEQWVDRFEMSVFLTRNVARVYPILTFVSASGSAQAQLSEGTKTVAWDNQA